MIKAYIREIEDTKRAFLGEFSVSDIPLVVKSFKDNETYFEKRMDAFEHDSQVENLYAQYVVDNDSVIFEIVMEM